MHTHLFDACGIDAVYVAFDVSPKRASELAEAIRTLDIRGVNLTVPFKSAILNDLDEVTQAGVEAQAVNVVIQHDHCLTGYNTDGEGFVHALEREFPETSYNRRVLVLGAGGAARAIAASLSERGAPSVHFLNRTPSRAEQASVHLAKYFPNTRFSFDALSVPAFAAAAPEVDLVINCTAAGTSELIETFDVKLLCESSLWCDINYWMEAPPALDQCKRRGIKTQTGLGMLIHQGLLSFELFTGYPVEPEPIYALLQG
jgi:shikimate dehydrogenase